MAFEYNVINSKVLGAEQDENCEAYFDVDHESENKLPFQTYIKKEPESPIYDWQHSDIAEHEPNINIKLEAATPPVYQRRALRRSLSASNLHALVYNTRLYTSSIRSGSSQTLNENKERKKYMSVAEEIYHFQRDTPERFHSQAKYKSKWLTRINNESINFNNQEPKCTIAKSPMLLTKTRTRPVTVLSRKELEEKELEEIKKHTMKANPVPQSLASDGKSGVPWVAPMPKTKCVPFNLTEVKKKPIVQPLSPKPIFVAKAVPKHVLEKPFKLKASRFYPTVPISPNITKSRSADNMHKLMTREHSARAKSNNSSINSNPPPVLPFSFFKRDEALKKKHDEKIKKMIEEETKIKPFKANPIPAAIQKYIISSSSSSDQKENRSTEGSIRKSEFKPKPPTVLYKKPFIPKLSGKRTEPAPFTLASTERAFERSLFDHVIKLKEEENERLRQKMEEARLQMENEEVKQLREKMVHKPNPFRCHHQFVLQPSNHLITVPQSPNITKYKHKK